MAMHLAMHFLTVFKPMERGDKQDSPPKAQSHLARRFGSPMNEADLGKFDSSLLLDTETKTWSCRLGFFGRYQ